MSGHARERAAWFLAALSGAALAASPVARAEDGSGLLPPALAALALAITLGIVPGAWLARQVAPLQASDARAAFALLASPFACGAALAVARACGVPPAYAARGFAVLLALLAAWEALRPRRREGVPPSTRLGWYVALGVGATLLAAHLANPALSARSDGAFHAGVVWAVERRLPPEDPFFAGLPLRYAWGLHAWAAGWLTLAPKLGAYTPLVWSSVAAAAAALLAVSALARRLGGSPGVCVLAQVLALVGAAPFGWVALAARAVTGNVRGAAELSRALDHGADTAFRALDPGWLHPSLVLPLDKFVVLTPFAWSLAGGVVTLLALSAWCEARSRAAFAWLALSLAAATFAHPMAGLALSAALAVGAVAAAIPSRAARSLAGGLLLAILAAVVLVAPYWVAVGAAGGEGDVPARFAVRAAGVLSTLVAGAVVLPMAARVLFADQTPDPFAHVALGMLGSLALAACVVWLGGENQSKFLNLAFLLASAPAALGWARLAPRWRPAAILTLVLALAPTLAAALWAYSREDARSHDAPSRPPAAILTAITQLVPHDGVLVDATQDTTRGAAPALPGETGHSVLWSGGFMARKWGHPRESLRARAAAARALEQGTWPDGTAGGVLTRLEREIWLVAPEAPARAADPRERVVARAEGVRLVRWIRR